MSDHILALMTAQFCQITALAIVVAVVVKLAAKNRPHLAHALWMLVLIKCVTPPLWGHSLGVFSQLQARLMPDESATRPALSGPSARVPVAMTETLVPAPEIEVPDSEHSRLETYEPGEMLSMPDTKIPEEVSLVWDGGIDIEQDELQSLSVEGEAVQSLHEQEASIAYAEPALPLEIGESETGWFRLGWLLPFGLAAGAILTLCLLVFRYLRCLREIHRHRTMEFDEPLRERVQQLSRQLRVRRIPQIIVSDVLFGPAVLGLLRHTIVLPRCLFETAEGSQSRSFLPERTFAARRTAQGQTSAPRQSDAVKSISSGRVAASREVPPGRRDLLFLDPILAHELLHIRRGDLRTGTLQAIVQSLWWFHPAVWLTNRWLSREAERCCDEQVIAELGCSPAQYARSLLSVIECKHQLQPIPVFPGMKPVEITSQRMERIMSLKIGLKNRTPLWCWLMIVAMAFIVLPGAAIQLAADDVKPEVLLKTADNVKQPLTTSVRLDDNFVLSQDVPVTGSTIIAYVNKKPITVGSLLAESSTALLLRHLSEMTDSDRRRIVTEAIKNFLPTYVYEEVVLQHFRVNLSAEQQAQLAAAQERRDAKLLEMLPGMLEQSKRLESQENLLANAFQQYKMRDQAANGDLSRLCRDALVARYIEEAPATDAVCERDATLQHCRDLLLRARLRNDVSLSFSNTSLMDVLRSIAKDYGINIAVKTSLGETKPTAVTFHCENEPLDDALRTIVEPFGLCVRLHEEFVEIEAADSKQTLSKGATANSGTTANAPIEEQSEEADNVKNDSTSASEDHGPEKYDGPLAPEWIRKSDKAPPRTHLVPDRPMPSAIQHSSDPMVKLVWEARESSRRRLLTTDEHTPWQLMHGLLGLRQDFVVSHNGRIINGLEWIQSGPTFKDEPPFQEDQPWFQKTKHGGRAHPYLRPYLFEGHINQFAAILASCRLPLNAQFGTPDGPITMQDLITNAQMTANETEEVSWTLSLLSRYLPPDTKWVNAKGEEWSMERLVKVEVGKNLDGPCGGTCGLFALAVARNEYQRSGKSLEGVWLEAEQKIQKYVKLTRAQQNADGTLCSHYFKGGEAQRDFDKRLASSGALLQFLITAASDEQLKEDWLRRAVEATANDLMSNRKAFVSCSPLFETTNAFGIYLDRVSVSAVADVKPDSKEVSLAERLVLMTYPVADLVFRHQSVVSAVSRSTDSAVEATPDVVPAAASTSGTAAAPDQIVDVPGVGRQADTLTWKADLAPLVELIKASVEPDSWDERGTVAVEEATLSLIIRQSEEAHEKIGELLSQLRDAQDQSVRISCLVVHLTQESQTKWLEEQCSLHPLEQCSRWALLPQHRCESFTQALLEQKPEVLSRPVVRTISGQTATITVGAVAAGGAATATTGIRLEVTPHVLPYSNVIRLQHSFSVGKFTNKMPMPVESLVGSGQTLLLLVDDPADKEKPDAARSQYLLMMTPKYIPQKEEGKEVSGATPEDSADAVNDTPRGHE